MILQQRNHFRRQRSAFTLMEVLVVVAIILALAGLGGYYLLGQATEARKSTAKLQVGNLTKAAQTYALQHREQFPDNLQMLLQRDDLGGPYLETPDALIDPWGNMYQYNKAGSNNNGLKPDIWSESPYGKIGNWSALQGTH